MEDIVPKWLIQLLKWGGIALAVIFAIALYIVETSTPEAGAAAGETAAPIQLYWILLVVGVVAAIVGFVMERRKPAAGGGGWRAL